MVPDRIEREVVIEASAERVWSAVTEAEHMGRWFGDAGAEVELRPGGRLVVRWSKHGTAHGVVERVDRPRIFSFRWSLEPGEAVRSGNSTLVEFTLVPEAERRTRLRVVESGFLSLDGGDAARARHVEQNVGGWRAELEELRAHVERQPA